MDSEGIKSYPSKSYFPTAHSLPQMKTATPFFFGPFAAAAEAPLGWLRPLSLLYTLRCPLQRSHTASRTGTRKQTQRSGPAFENSTRHSSRMLIPDKTLLTN